MEYILFHCKTEEEEEEHVEEKEHVEIKLTDAKVADTEDNQFFILFYTFL